VPIYDAAMRRLFALAAVSLLTSCGGQTGSARGTDLQGTVMRGPVSPTCSPGQACSEPAAGVTLRFSKGATVVARARTGADGSYRVTLAAGRYSVAGPVGLQPRQINVPGTGSRRLDLSIDTRIR
jgi:hypothetical protein